MHGYMDRTSSKEFTDISSTTLFLCRFIRRLSYSVPQWLAIFIHPRGYEALHGTKKRAGQLSVKPKQKATNKVSKVWPSQIFRGDL